MALKWTRATDNDRATIDRTLVAVATSNGRTYRLLRIDPCGSPHPRRYRLTFTDDSGRRWQCLTTFATQRQAKAEAQGLELKD